MRQLRTNLIARFLLAAVSLCLLSAGVAASAQTRKRPHTPQQPAKAPAKPTPTPTPNPASDQVETLKIDTNLVTVPVVATGPEGRHVADLRQEELSIEEDGVKQQISLFATTRLPISVVLMLDTSASTRDKLSVIQAAAIAFVEKLDASDRVKVISFDNQIHEFGGFSSDRAALKAAILKTTSGEGTKLYDAFDLALASLRKLDGRKAIVLFSDGVDWHSDQASDFSTLQWLDEEGVVVYPIRYNTRADSERIARQGGVVETPELATIEVIRRPPPSGTTAPTFPEGDDPRNPPSDDKGNSGPMGLPSAAEILRRSRTGVPPGEPSDVPPTRPRKPTPGAPKKDKSETERRGRHGGDPITEMMDRLYLVADKYLNDLADKTGGAVLRVDDLSTLPDAFTKVASELQMQYLIGYYPTNKSHDGDYRNINVTSSRPQVVIRARPGYRR